MEEALARAVSAEDYGTAARLRDELQSARGDGVLGVEQANARFYAAFERSDAAEMARAWGEGDHVRCTHPSAQCIVGRAAVLESWGLVFRSGAKMKIRTEDVEVHVGGQLAILTCVEVVDAASARGRLAATNVFELQQGVWKMVHHHASAASD